MPDNPGPRGGPIRILDLRTGKDLAAQVGQERYFTSLACSPDGKLLASRDYEDTVEVWDARTGKRLRRWRDSGSSVWALVFAPDGRTLALGGRDGRIRLWPFATAGGPVPFTEAPFPIYSLEFSADGKRLVASTGVSVWVWDVASKRALGRPRGGHEAAIQTMALTADGRTLVTSSWDTTVVWELSGDRERRRIELPRRLRLPLSISRDARSVALPCEDGSVRVVDPLTGKVRCRVESSLDTARYADGHSPAAILTADGKAVAFLCKDGKVAVHDTTSGKLLGRIGNPGLGLAQGLMGLTLSPEGAFLLANTFHGGIGLPTSYDTLYEVKSGQHIRPLGRDCFPASHGGSSAFSPDGRTLVVEGRGGDVERWDLAARRPLPALTGAQERISSLFFSPDGKYMWTSGYEQSIDGNSSYGPPGLRVWYIRTGRLLPHLGRAQGPAHAACLSPDNRLLAVLHADGSLRLWEVVTGKERARIATGLPSSAFDVPPLFTPDGRLLLTADGATVLLWDLTGAAALRR